MVGSMVYKSKTQSITTSSTTEPKFIATHSTNKLTIYLWMLSKQLGFEQKEPTSIHIENLPVLQMINNNTSPTDLN